MFLSEKRARIAHPCDTSPGRRDDELRRDVGRQDLAVMAAAIRDDRLGLPTVVEALWPAPRVVMQTRLSWLKRHGGVVEVFYPFGHGEHGRRRGHSRPVRVLPARAPLREPAVTEGIQQKIPYSVEAADILLSPLREALRALANEGLVTVVRCQGVFVTDFTIDEDRELLELKEAFDELAIGLVADRCTDGRVAVLQENLEGLASALHSQGAQVPCWPSDFRLWIFEAAGNARLREHGLAVHTQLRLVRFRLGAAQDRMTSAHQERLGMLTAIRRHDPDLAERRMRDHLVAGAAHILEQPDTSA